jgi:hypothetical protein
MACAITNVMADTPGVDGARFSIPQRGARPRAHTARRVTAHTNTQSLVVGVQCTALEAERLASQGSEPDASGVMPVACASSARCDAVANEHGSNLRMRLRM